MSTAVLLETTAPVTVSVDAWLQQLRATGIGLPRPAEVRDYVKQFPDIVPVVRQACALAVAEFAGKAGLSLELHVDPEIDDRYLALYIGGVSADEWVWQAIERIEEKYADGLVPASGWLVVLFDCRGGAAN